MRVVIAEDEALLREGLALLLGGAGLDVVATTGDARQVPVLVAEHEPDLLLTDIRMPPGRAEDGLTAALEVRRERPRTAVLVLSQHVHRRYAEELLGTTPTGVGYLLKQRVADAVRFCRDVRTVATGGTVLDPEVVTVMLARARQGDGVLRQLTPRQAAVLALVAEGRSNAAIARRLRVTEKSVGHQVSRIYELLGLPASDDDHRRVLAVVRYLSEPREG